MFTWQTIYCLTENELERLKVSPIKQSLDNKIYESNHRNTDFNDLPFDGDERLIARQQLYRIKDNILFI